jgi:hypothetical protein
MRRERNQLRYLAGISELPITTFRTLPFFHNYRHLDVDACTDRELTAIVRQAARQNMPHVVMLMHSFSFVRRTLDGYVANMENVIKLRKFLGAIERIDNLEVSAPSPLMGEGRGEGDLSTGLLLTYHRAWTHWGRSRKHKLLAIAPLFVLMVILLFVLWLR